MTQSIRRILTSVHMHVEIPATAIVFADIAIWGRPAEVSQQLVFYQGLQKNTLGSS